MSEYSSTGNLIPINNIEEQVETWRKYIWGLMTVIVKTGMDTSIKQQGEVEKCERQQIWNGWEKCFTIQWAKFEICSHEIIVESLRGSREGLET